ncbi:MAG: carboxypeptidase-like regulatory domain-containing protein [Flavobacterium sp.]|nr:carboxypeptidase-like regulatory domain-containing protein [Flavobacterium sp.]
MTNNLQIHIPIPCHENWDAMTLEDKGRFCVSCAKVVVDFSVMTDNEVLNYLKKNTGNTCGHFTNNQLDRPIIATQLQPKRTWRYWLASIAWLLVMVQRSTAQTKTAITQGKVLVKKPTAKKQIRLKTQEIITTTGIIGEPIIMGDVRLIEQPIAPNTFIEGTVVDDNNRPIAFASVTTKAKIGIASTDSLGKFSIDNKYKLDSISLVVSSVGYETKEVSISAKTKASQVIALKSKAVQLPDVTVVGYGTINCLFGRVGGLVAYRKVSKRDTIPLAIAKVFKNAAFTIYPNPVNKSGTIHIAVKEAGNYEVQILSNQSKLLYTQQHSTQSLKQVIQIAVPSGAVAGMYYVRLINTATQKQGVDKLMIQ